LNNTKSTKTRGELRCSGNRWQWFKHVELVTKFMLEFKCRNILFRRWNIFQKRIARNKFDICVFIRGSAQTISLSKIIAQCCQIFHLLNNIFLHLNSSINLVTNSTCLNHCQRFPEHLSSPRVLVYFMTY
jgi:hypothetical protein